MRLFGDIRQSWRSIVRSPGYTLTCVVVLSVGIGATVAIFSMLHSVVLAALPYPDADRLVFVWEHLPNVPPPLGDRISVSRRNYVEWKRQNAVFSEMAAFHEARLAETGVERPRHVSVGSVSVELLPLLGAETEIGRLFPPDAETKGADRVAVLSHSYYESRFHGDRNAIGKSLSLDGVSYTVIGVLRPGFYLPATRQGLDQKKPDVWVPLSRLWTTSESERQRQLFVVAKLKPEVTLERARRDMAAIADRLEQADPEFNKSWKSTVFPLAVEDTPPTLHRAMYVLFAAVTFLLLIACANLANLSLARATNRSREFGVRLALGASRWRVTLQMLSESLIIAGVGAAAGVLLAHWALKGLMALNPAEFQRPELIRVDLQVLGFAVAAGLVTAILFGLAPAIALARQGLDTAMRAQGSRGSSAARSWTRHALIATEVALALMLVTGAGLMIQSFRNLLDTGVGLRIERIATIDIDLPDARYPSRESRSRFFRELIVRVQGLPGVESAGVTNFLPLHSLGMATFYIAGQPEPPPDSLPICDFTNISPEYLSVMGIQLQSGRYFTSQDAARDEEGKDSVAIVNQAWARKFLNDAQPLGQRILTPDKKRSYEIVGVVSDSRPMGVENGTRPQIYWPAMRIRSGSLVVRTRARPDSMAQTLQNAVWSLDRSLPINKVETMEEHLKYWQSQREFNTVLFTVFAGLALLLAMIGVYGVLANQVASRTREIGIRVAIGAQASGIARLVLKQSLWPVAIGLVAGLAGSVALSRFVGALLFGVQASDTMTRVLGVCAILLVAPLAVFVPLRRALAISCTEALREE